MHADKIWPNKFCLRAMRKFFIILQRFLIRLGVSAPLRCNHFPSGVVRELRPLTIFFGNTFSTLFNYSLIL